MAAPQGPAQMMEFGRAAIDLLLDRLFEAPPAGPLRAGESCLAAAMALPAPVAPFGAPATPVFWGCGLRNDAEAGGVPLGRLSLPAVRGPLTRSALRLGDLVPAADPLLLLPLLAGDEAASGSPAAGGAALLVPRFEDGRTDEVLRALGGGEATVLRPRVRGPAGVEAFLQALRRARFVLTASLPVALAAAAFGIPFAFWNDGEPDADGFPARDVAASLGLSFQPVRSVAEGEPWFRRVAPDMRSPPLWPLLASAPMPARSDIMMAAIRLDVSRFGSAVLDRPVPEAGVRAAQPVRVPPPPARRLKRKPSDRERDRRPRPPRPPEPLADFELRKLERFMELSEKRIETLSREVESQAMLIAWMREQGVAIPGSAASEHLQALEARALAAETEREDMRHSVFWRLRNKVVRVSGRHPGAARQARRAAKLAWLVVSLRLMRRVRQRQRVQADAERLRASPLFDAAWYRSAYARFVSPETDPVLHYVWVGVLMGLDPHPLFSTNWYRERMPPGAPDNPLVHYLSGGSGDPHPLFDTAHYLSRLAEPPPPGVSALEHFLSAGAGAPDPNPVFHGGLYASEYPQAASHGRGPLAHYVEHGEAAGFAPHPLFDPAWYAARHPERNGLGPLAHYLHAGRQQELPTSAATEQLGEAFRVLPVPLRFPAVETPDISVIIPAYGHAHETWRCLAALSANTGALAFEVILADDRPGSPTAPLFTAENLQATVNGQNLGFLRSCNAAARRARGRHLVFLNNDTSVGPDWLRPMVRLADADRRVGIVGCKLMNTDGTVQEAGGIIHANGWGYPYASGDDPRLGACNFVREVDVVTGACFLVRRDLFERVGGFDDRYAPAFYEEFDLATALRDIGYKVLYQPASVVVHHGSASYGSEIRDKQSHRNHAKFCRKWRTLLARQPNDDAPLFVARERPSPRGVILVIDDKVPEYDKHAGAVTLFQYLELMRELGLKVIFHPQDGQPLEPYTDALQQRGIEVLHAPETLERWLRHNGRHLDYVWTARPYVTFPILDLLKRHTGAPILYYTHDLHYLREMRRHELDGSAWALEESERLKPMELGIFAAVDRVMTPSAEEAVVIRSEVPDAHVTVVPPYLFKDADIDEGSLSFAARNEIMFVGGFDHTPNVDAALWLVGEIMPLVWAALPEVRVLIVGNAPPVEVRALAGDRVEVTGFVPSLDPYHARARVSVSPLRYGAGVKGKIVGALQAGVPVVTTPCGNEGIQLADGVEALIGDDAPALANAVIRLMRDEALCRSMAVAGAQVVRTRFSAGRARTVLLELLGDDLCPVCGTRPRNPRPGTPGTPWRRRISCTTCMADNEGAALADALLAPYRRHRIGSLREGLSLLGDLQVLAVGAQAPELRELAALPGFTRVDEADAATLRALPPLDLLIAAGGAVPAVPGLLPDIHRALRPGGRLLLPVPEDGVLPLEAIRAAGFRIARHDHGSERDPARCVRVLEATR
ncbi:glycosyltransferase [Rhizosaccharibacter radicis]|uniref:Glycosyltransferase n=1 Tax=Rhizosaccharibacter radicis TaxID=2782605 RepID=A0ABT1VT71_9PROT|nr:glycosyltransferase [Acetobacteraceae bacterium KSS12]